MLNKLKMMIDEENYPCFEDWYLGERLNEIKGDEDALNKLARELCLTKAGIVEIKLGDITIPSPREHFLMLAQRYRKNHTGMVVRADEQKIL